MVGSALKGIERIEKKEEEREKEEEEEREKEEQKRRGNKAEVLSSRDRDHSLRSFLFYHMKHIFFYHSYTITMKSSFKFSKLKRH